MYREILSKSWTDIMEEDIELKSNNFKHVVEFKASQYGLNDNSMFVIFYNICTNTPMILMHSAITDFREPEVIDGFTFTVNNLTVGGIPCREVIYLSDIITDNM